MAEIVRERQELDQDKAKQEKRITAMIAEERLKLESEFEKLTAQHSQSYDKPRVRKLSTPPTQ